MNAATLERAPAQALLDGMPPVADESPRFAIHGVVVHRPELRHTTAGTVVLQLLVAQHLHHHPHAHPVLVTWVYPDLGCPNATAQAAKSRAAALPAGTEVLVVGCGLEVARLEGAPVLQLIHCERIEAAATVHHRFTHPQES